MWPFRSRKSDEEVAKGLRIDAGKLRILGQFDAAYENYKRAYALYEKLGDTDAQCNVLCSLAETARRDERQQFLEKIEAVCTTMRDPDEKARALKNLDALKERLRNS